MDPHAADLRQAGHVEVHAGLRLVLAAGRGQVGLEDAGGGAGQEVLVDHRGGHQVPGGDELAGALAGRELGDARRQLVGEVGELALGQAQLVGGQVLGPDGAGHGGTVAPIALEDLVHLGEHGVVDLAALLGQGDAALLHLAEAHPQRALAEGAVGLAEGALLVQGAEGGLAQQDVRPLPGRGALDLVDHLDAAGLHAAVELLDVEHARREVVDVRGGHAPDVGGHGGDLLQPAVPGLVDRLGGQLEDGGGAGHQLVGLGLRQALVACGAVGQLEQLVVEQAAGGQELGEVAAQVGVEEARVLGHQHRGEDAEGVARQLVPVDRAEGGGDHRDGGGRVPQVVEAHRFHAERGEDAGHVAELLGGAHADGAVALGGDALDGAQALGGVAQLLQVVAVHGLGDLDERGVGRHLLSVHAGHVGGEGCSELVLCHGHGGASWVVGWPVGRWVRPDGRVAGVVGATVMCAISSAQATTPARDR